MYCSACGHEATIDVNYCKRCGNVLSPQTSIQSKPFSLTGPSWAFALMVMVMVGTVFGAVVNMAEMQISAVALTWMVIAGLGTVVALVALIFRQLSRMTNVNREKPKIQTSTPQINAELYQARPGALPEHMPSVTEHTTRTFQPIYREPVERQK
jgi:hypothetical protein